MTEQIDFTPYLGWVNVPDPANIPADVRIISAEDLLRYETFAASARTAVNELITTTEAHSSSIGTLEQSVAGLTGLDGKAVSAAKAYDVTVAGGAKTLATVTAGAAYTSFLVEVTLVGRSSAGDIYLKALRYIRPENGVPVRTAPVPDVVLGNITVGFTSSGPDGTAITATAAGVDALLTAHIEVLAGAGNSSGAARTVSLAMA